MSETLAAPAEALLRDTAARPPARPRIFSRKRLALGTVALLALGGATAFGEHWWHVGRFLESTDDAYVGGDTTVLASRIPGFIAEVAVTDNQSVKAGDLLLRIDDRDYRAALAKAEAAVAAQLAARADLVAQRALQDATIRVAAADVTSAEAETWRARVDAERYRALVATHASSEQRSQQAEADSRKAAAGEARTRAALEAAQRRLDVIAAQAQQVEAALQAAQADRETARLNLGYTELRAPIDGVVGNRSARAGAYATIGAQLLAVVPARGLWVDANFKESQLAHMQPGAPVQIVADVLPGRVFHGHVASLSPATGAQFSVLPAENATGNFTKIVQRVPVRVALDAADSALGLLRPGLSVSATVDQRSARS